MSEPATTGELLRAFFQKAAERVKPKEVATFYGHSMRPNASSPEELEIANYESLLPSLDPAERDEFARLLRKMLAAA